MSYRDETEALRARNEMLENELADARKRIAELTGESGVAITLPESEDHWGIAAPGWLLLERTTDTPLAPAKVDEILRLLQTEISPLRTGTRHPDGLEYRFGTTQVSITKKGLGSHIRLWVDHSGYAAFAVICGLIAGLVAMPVVGSTLGPLAVVIALPICMAMVFVVMRRIFGRSVHRQRANLARIFGEVMQIAQPPMRIGGYEVSEMIDVDEDEEKARRA